ncbi:hypothetical protein [Actinomadura sp. 9N407]|uniref:hypothetical protein n=1 Tax=Actinomadura sp. 9N407 TaxID=3375154 RepID=UPI0037B9F921
MSIRVERSHVHPPGDGQGGAAGGQPVAVRLAGLVLAAGAAAWAVGTVIVGDKVSEGIVLTDTVTGMGYVAGLFCLVLVVLSTRATGPRKGRAIPIALLVMLPGAFLFNLISLGHQGKTYEELPPWLMAVDACWPLANLTMLVLGVAVAKVGVYRGFLRWQFLFCGLWLPVSMAGQAIGGSASAYVSAVWLLATYTILGLRLALRPADVRPSQA